MATSESKSETGIETTIDFKAVAARLLANRINTLEADHEAGETADALQYRRDWYAEIGVPERLCLLMRELQETQIVQRVRAWTDAPREAWCLVLSSGVGAGKSTAAAWWLWHRAKGRRVGPLATQPRWITAAALSRVDGYDGSIAAIAGAAELVIDDAGAEYADRGGNSLARLEEVINARYERFLPTIITTNLALAEFQTRHDARISDRVRAAEAHGGGFYRSSCPSMRGGS